MKETYNLQDSFLNTARRERIPLTVFLVNGFQIRCTVKSFDVFTVVISAEPDGRQQLIYKHAISTIIPSRALSIAGGGDSKGQETCPEASTPKE